ncbi:MAG TPA: Rrf2 family transcriptional regulator [Bacteroidia bacterium]|nr:Rrf2 family transcriptional regulator [Bacteroidia bacterium]
MLSQKCKYALRCVMYLSIHSENDKKSADEIAEYLKIPKAFTSKILQQLVNDDIVSSAKGPGGGFYLSASNKKKKVLDVVKSIDGLDFFVNCGLGLSECSNKNPCPLHNTFIQIREKLYQMFKKTSIQELSDEIIQNGFKLKR